MPAVPATAQVFWLFGAWSEIVCNNVIYMYMYHSASLLHASESPSQSGGERASVPQTDPANLEPRRATRTRRAERYIALSIFV